MDLSLVVGKLLCKCLFDGCRTSAPAWPDQDGPHKPGIFHLFLPHKRWPDLAKADDIFWQSRHRSSAGFIVIIYGLTSFHNW